MGRRTLTDAQGARVGHLLPGRKGLPGRSGADTRLFLDAGLWQARGATPWRDLPPGFGKWTGVHARFRRGALAGVRERLFKALADSPDFEYVFVDATVCQVHADATGAKGGLAFRASADRAAA